MMKRWMAALACGVTLLWGVSAGTLAAKADDRPAPASAPFPVRLRVLTYNVRHGEGGDGKVDLERTARVITSLKPDLVALQEIDRKTRRTHGVDQVAELGRLTGMHVAFGSALDFEGGQYGVVVLSRWPIGSSVTHPLPNPEQKEPRTLLVTEPKAPLPIRFCSTHLCAWSARNRLAQLRAIDDILLREGGAPTILAGDFNAVPKSEAIRSLVKHWAGAGGGSAAPTSPADKPVRKIDYVVYRPADRFRLIETEVVDEPLASDHRPVLTVFELLPEQHEVSMRSPASSGARTSGVHESFDPTSVIVTLSSRLGIRP
jgi:endonuclease/exonuclease/phosphatase family metal-dependent hydrolase